MSDEFTSLDKLAFDCRMLRSGYANARKDIDAARKSLEALALMRGIVADGGEALAQDEAAQHATLAAWQAQEHELERMRAEVWHTVRVHLPQCAHEVKHLADVQRLDALDVDALCAELRSVEAAATQAKARPEEPEPEADAMKPPRLTPKARAVLEIIQKHGDSDRETGPQCNEIVAILAEGKPSITMSLSTLTTHIIPKLKASCGVTNDGNGYYIPRPDRAARPHTAR